MVGEEATILEILARVGGGVEDAPELVELVEGVLTGPGESAQRPEVQAGGIATIDADRLGDDLNTLAASRPPSVLLAFIEEDELQRLEVRGQDQQVVLVALTEGSHQFVANLGCQRLRLGKDDPEEAIFVLRKQLDTLQRVRRFPGQPNRLGSEDGPPVRLVAELMEEGHQSVGRRQVGDVPWDQVEVGCPGHVHDPLIQKKRNLRCDGHLEISVA